MSKHTVEIDTRTILRFWLVLLGIALVIFFFYKALTGLMIIGISIFLAIALKPLVNRLNRFLTKHLGVNKSHRTASAALAYSTIVISSLPSLPSLAQSSLTKLLNLFSNCQPHLTKVLADGRVLMNSATASASTICRKKFPKPSPVCLTISSVTSAIPSWPASAPSATS